MSVRIMNLFIQKYGRLPTEFDSDYLEMLRMSKYRILAIPDLKPGKCANCGSAKNDGRKYVDFGLEVDFFGIVYLCGFCLKDIANNMDLFRSYIDEIGALKAELLNIKVQQQKEDSLEHKMLHTFREVKEYIASIYPDLDNSSPNGSSDVVTNKGSVKTESGSDGTESESVKSDSGKRPTELRSLAELLEAESSKPG